MAIVGKALEEEGGLTGAEGHIVIPLMRLLGLRQGAPASLWRTV